MEHIVQFAIGIDDEAIKERIEATAEKQIRQNIERQIRNSLFEARYYGADADEKSRMNSVALRIVETFLEKHKDELLEKASEHLAEKLARTKAAKAIIGGNNENKT